MSMDFYDFVDRIRNHDMSLFESNKDPFGDGFSFDDDEKKEKISGPAVKSPDSEKVPDGGTPDGKTPEDNGKPSENPTREDGKKKIEPETKKSVKRNMFGEVIDTDSPFVWKHDTPYEVGDDGTEIDDAQHLLMLSKSMVQDLNRMRNELPSNPSQDDIDKINKIATDYSQKYRRDPDMNIDKINGIMAARIGRDDWQKSDIDYNAAMVNDDVRQANAGASLRDQEQTALTGMLTGGKRKGYGVDPNVIKWRKARLQIKASAEDRKKNANRAIEGLKDAKNIVVSMTDTHPEIVGDWYFRQLPRIIDRGLKMKQDADDYTLDERLTGRNNLHPKRIGKLTNAVFPGGQRGIVSSVGYAFGARYFPVMEAEIAPTGPTEKSREHGNPGEPPAQKDPGGLTGNLGKDAQNLRETAQPASIPEDGAAQPVPAQTYAGPSGSTGATGGTFNNAIKIIANSAAYYPENIRSWADKTLAPAVKTGYEKLASVAGNDRDRQYWQNRADAVHTGFLSRVKTAIAGETKKDVNDDLPGQPVSVPNVANLRKPVEQPTKTVAASNASGFAGETFGHVVERTDAPAGIESRDNAIRVEKQDAPAENTGVVIKKEDQAKQEPPKTDGEKSETPAVPVQKQPAQSVPVQTQPVPAVPVQTQPVPAVPVQKQPVPAVPVQTQPVPAVPVQKQPVQSAPVQKQPAQPVPVQKQPAQSAPVQKQTVQSAPVQTQSAQSVPVQTQSAQVVNKQDSIKDTGRARYDRRTKRISNFKPQISSVMDALAGGMTMFESQKYDVSNLVDALRKSDGAEDTAERDSRIADTCNGRTMTTRVNSAPVGYDRQMEKNWRRFYED